MKKTAMMPIILLLGLGICFSAFAQNGVIRELSGTVELKPSEASNFRIARVGDRLSADTVISTGFRSTALIEVGSSLITARPLTRLTLMEIHSAEGTETINMDLQAGRVRVDVNPPAGAKASMTISSPNSSASVRGTDFLFDGYNISVNEGTVDFRGSRGILPVPVSPGSTSSVATTGKASNSVYISPGRDSGSDDGFVVGNTTYSGGAMGGDGLLPSGPAGPGSGITQPGGDPGGSGSSGVDISLGY